MPLPSGPVDDHRDTTILVVDDEPTLLALVRTMLWRAGFTVLEASSGEEALRVAAGHASPIQLLLTDILMPETNGYQLAAALRAKRPEVKILYMSGFTDQVLLESTGRKAGEAQLIRKPFTQYKLITKISEILESPVTTA